MSHLTVNRKKLERTSEITTSKDKSIHLAVNKLQIRLILGRMIVIRHQSSPKSSFQLYRKHRTVFTNSIMRTVGKVPKVPA